MEELAGLEPGTFHLCGQSHKPIVHQNSTQVRAEENLFSINEKTKHELQLLDSRELNSQCQCHPQNSERKRDKHLKPGDLTQPNSGSSLQSLLKAFILWLFLN